MQSLIRNTERISLRFVASEDGIQHAEEALLLGLIALVAVVSIRPLGEAIAAGFEEAKDAFCGGPNPNPNAFENANDNAAFNC